MLLIQPEKGRVEINSDGRTARYVISPTESLEDLDSQNFSYKVQIFPNTSQATSALRFALIYSEEEDDCHNGKPAEYEKLKPTDERFVNV